MRPGLGGGTEKKEEKEEKKEEEKFPLCGEDIGQRPLRGRCPKREKNRRTSESGVLREQGR